LLRCPEERWSARNDSPLMCVWKMGIRAFLTGYE
jgi:hypothetical protein